MGGSSGTFGGKGRSPAEIAAKIQSQVESSAAQFDAELAGEFNVLLARFNTRNSQEVAVRLANIKDALHDEIEASFDTFFGGSVAKHTYVDGISDVDSMLVVSGPMADADPRTVLNEVSRALREKLDGEATVTSGRVAITVTYNDGMEVQLVPTVSKNGNHHIPAWEENTWSPINPDKFRHGLTKRNNECNGKLIPTLKLAKAVNATLPENARLTGYHIESLGVAAFRGYAEERTTVRMLPYFFKRASELVLSPMVDRTGQSVHVDAHLGAANSDLRQGLSHTLARLHQRMANASAAGSKDRWREILGE